MKQIGIGLLGFGTVGAGVVEGLQRNGRLISQRLGHELVLRKIADLDLDTDRGVKVDPAIMTQDARSVVNDPAVDVVVELIGGTGIARELIKEALAAGKPVVTANKKLLAEFGAELFRTASENSSDIYFGASVGGGIPVIRALREGLSANCIQGISGILNGTCNYILTRMEQAEMPFDVALAEAQKAGYAEADPSLDIDGWDTAHKVAILASLSFGFCVPLQGMHVEGIRTLAATDILYARDLGYRIKLLGLVKKAESGVDVRVHPALVPHEHLLAAVSGVYNAVMITGDMTGDTMYYGQGAGRNATAGTVLADVADAARNLAADCSRRIAALPGAGETLPMCPIESISSRYYLRLMLPDRAGVLATVATVLGKHDVSLASVLQKEEHSSGLVPVVAVTHQTFESGMNRALEELAQTSLCSPDGIVRLRIED